MQPQHPSVAFPWAGREETQRHPEAEVPWGETVVEQRFYGLELWFSGGALA